MTRTPSLPYALPTGVITQSNPPGGHLIIANERVYPVLNDIFTDIVSIFDAPDIFHMGGDEV
jgi:hypothetical protein